MGTKWKTILVFKFVPMKVASNAINKTHPYAMNAFQAILWHKIEHVALILVAIQINHALNVPKNGLWLTTNAKFVT